MRLNKAVKRLVMGNAELRRYCRRIGIDMRKLEKCNIEEIKNYYIFGLSKENVPESTAGVPLDIDIDSQPDAVLVIIIENDVLIFETTDKTYRVMKDKNKGRKESKDKNIGVEVDNI